MCVIADAHDALMKFLILEKMSGILISLTGKQNNVMLFLPMFFHLPFHLSSTHVRSTISCMYLFMC